MGRLLVDIFQLLCHFCPQETSQNSIWSNRLEILRRSTSRIDKPELCLVRWHQPAWVKTLEINPHCSIWAENQERWKGGSTLSKIGNSALNRVQAKFLISSFDPGSWPPNWLQGKAKISSPASCIGKIDLVHSYHMIF